MSDLLHPWPFQQECIDAVWDDTRKRVAAVVPTGGGKTVIFSHIAKRYIEKYPKRRVLILSHTDELVSQARDEFVQAAPHINVGIVKGPVREVTAPVISASVQSLRSHKSRADIRGVGLIIVDECFPAGTMVGNSRIEDLQSGDMVPSWDESTGVEVLRPVVAVMRKTPAHMVRVHLDDGTQLACTPNHPIMTNAGWVPAGLLPSGEHVVSFTHDATAKAGSRNFLHRMSEDFYGNSKESKGYVQANGARLLLRYMSRFMGKQTIIREDVTHKQNICIRKNDKKKPYAESGSKGEDVADFKENAAQAKLEMGEWKAHSGTSTKISRIFRLANGRYICTKRWRTPVSLQTGYSASINEGVRGSGWGIPFAAGTPTLRPSQGRKATFRRVVDVEILESGCDGTYGGVCPDGYVYNIEVEDTHTYLINDGIIVHNCHHSSAKTYVDILEHYGSFDDTCPVKTVGVTATLTRNDKKNLADIWEDVVFKRDILWMIRNGYLLDVYGKRVEVPDLDFSQIKKRAGDYEKGALGHALTDSLAPELTAKAYTEHASNRSGLLFTPTIASAYTMAEAFKKEGFTCEVVHGKTEKNERRNIVKRFNAGEIQVVANCMALTEGFNAPRASCVVIARQTKSASLYQQMVGRGLRLYPGQTKALILDVVGASRTHDLRSLIDLTDARISENEELTLAERAEIAEREEAVVEDTTPVYYGPVEVKDFNPLVRESKRVWLMTTGGTYFLSAGEAYVFLVPCIGDCGADQWDVAWCSKPNSIKYPVKTGGYTEHRGVDLQYAFAWGEDVAEEMGGASTEYLSTKDKQWRKGKASPKALQLARMKGLDVYYGMTGDQVSNVIEIDMASRRIDTVTSRMSR